MMRKYRNIICGALCAVVLFSLYCTETDFDSPLDPSSSAYMPCTLTTNASPAAGGTVSRYPSGLEYYKPGTEVTVTATVANGYKFMGWSGASSSSDESVKVIMDGNVTLTANFKQLRTLTVIREPAAGGTVVVNGAVTTDAGITTHIDGDVVTVTARAADGHKFIGWSGASTSLDTSVTIAMNSNITLTANFMQMYKITYFGNGSNGGTDLIDPNSPYVSGSTVTVLDSGMLAREHYAFGGWNTASDGKGTAYAAGDTLTIIKDTALYAQWTPNRYTVTYDGNGNTGGAAPEAMTGAYDTPVTLANGDALVRTGYVFGGWGVDANGTGASYDTGSLYIVAGDVTLYAKWRPIMDDSLLVFVEGGAFMMGCTPEQENDCEDDEKPAREVTVDDFYIMKYEVTQGLWKEIMGTSMSLSCGNYGIGDDYPVYCVGWDDIVDVFIPALNEKTGKNYRLPTEAEWEYAARGGHNSVNHQRGSYYKYAGGDVIDSVAWYSSNSGSRTHEVGTKAPNELGIYDMSGNVWEWVSDFYDENYYKSNDQINPTGPASGEYRVYRGGGWDYSHIGCRVSYRDAGNMSGNAIGFRLVLPAPQ